MKNKMINPISRSSFRDEVYRTLKKAIVMLELQPGQRLNDKELADQFEISRTPVREALKRLEDEGLVESVPGSSTRVSPIDAEAANHAFTVVAALHSLAARLAVPLLTDNDIETMESCNRLLSIALERADVIKAIEADDSFHRIFLNAAGNPEIRTALDRISPKVHRLEISRFGSIKGLKSVEQHDQIITACKNRDKTAVSRLVEKNWLSLGELLSEQMD
ncbi:GntR family transcriptional regulator [Paenibacillus harenae]|uniref:GntR family transcriptional regulator n=1 Tax=Paenibacillus harenae TaxID=306543 RepID=UPI000490FD60|nr:GntR family transcriptional regulator [Paenibacillus harenae]